LHISVDIWINRLLDKIKNYEPPEDAEPVGDDADGEEPKPLKWLTDLEEEVSENLKVGKGPSDD
jgi:hypothetical protein